MQLMKFLASMQGRWLRGIAGAVIIVLGLLVVKDTGGLILTFVGLIPLLAGVFDFCVFSPLFGGSFSGKAIREGK